MTGPAAALRGRRSPADGVLVRPLSAPMAGLLRDGDQDGRYASRSEAVLATALAAASAGWTESGWREVLASSALSDWSERQRRKGGSLAGRNPGDADRRLATTWAKAARRAVERPAVGDAPSVRAELAALLCAADADPGVWAGAAGVTDRAVLAVLVDVAVAACTMTPSVSSRQVSEAANVSPSTAAVALARLVRRGWLRREQHASGPLAATWRLLRPSALPEPAERVEEVLAGLPPRPLLPPGGSQRGHDTFTHTVHGGLGRVAARLFDVLDDGAHGGLTVRELAVLTGLHPRTVTRHLVALQAADLAATGMTGGWARSLAAGDPDRLPQVLDAAAVLLGCTGTVAARTARHAVQREAFTVWWTDFTARRGWAVQRGLYRPEQPQLPLPLPQAA